MRPEYRVPLYAIWHLIWALLIAYTAAFVMLHDFSLYYTGLDYWHETAVWRTINYVIPQWHLVIIPAAFIVMIISIAGHILMTSIWRNEENLAMGCSLVIAILCVGLFIILFQGLSIVIFIPLIIEILLVTLIDKLLDKPVGKKLKRSL
jgi:hypothetical protein